MPGRGSSAAARLVWGLPEPAQHDPSSGRYTPETSGEPIKQEWPARRSLIAFAGMALADSGFRIRPSGDSNRALCALSLFQGPGTSLSVAALAWAVTVGSTTLPE